MSIPAKWRKAPTSKTIGLLCLARQVDRFKVFAQRGWSERRAKSSRPSPSSYFASQVYPSRKRSWKGPSLGFAQYAVANDVKSCQCKLAGNSECCSTANHFAVCLKLENSDFQDSVASKSALVFVRAMTTPASPSRSIENLSSTPQAARPRPAFPQSLLAAAKAVAQFL
jgi:hypothetical protein